MRARSSALMFSEGADRPDQANDTLRRAVSFSERKSRHGKTPHNKKIPGLDISEMTSEKLESFISLNVSTPLFKEWKIKAAHELATRYIEGKDSKKKNKAPRDHLKAYLYAEKEINAYTIEELEAKFFQLDVNGKNINIVKHWLESETSFNKDDITEIDKCIDNAKWNGLLREEIIKDKNTILIAWEKQLISSRLAAHYKKLKDEEKTDDNIIAAKFYERLVQHFKEHESPDAKISTTLKKVSPRFNQIRLLLARIAKLISVTVQSLPAPIKILFSILSLYFLITFLIDIVIIIKDGKAAFWEDNRPSRMANDGVWFAANFACFMLTLFLLPVAPVVAPILIGAITVAGFFFDVGAEIAIGMYGYKNFREMLKTIDAELVKLNHINIAYEFKRSEDFINSPSIRLHKQQIDQKKTLLEQREQILKKRAELDINRAYTIAIMSILAITAIALFFPVAFGFLPAAILPFLPVIAASVALIVGSVFGGIGKYIFWNFIMDKEFHTNVKEKFNNVITSIKGWFVSDKETMQEIKHPHKVTRDDWNITTTKHIRERTEMLYTENKLDGQNEMVKPEIGQNKNGHTPKSTSTDLLHRSPSGLLMIFDPKNTSVRKITERDNARATSEQSNVRHR